MATKIKGITIEIGGDTSGLEKALKSINTEIRGTQKQLQDVEKMLKFDPSNTELLAQKQQLLGKKIEETKDKLQTLADIESKLKESGVDENSEQFLALRREIIATEGQLNSLQNSFEETGDALNGSLDSANDKLQDVNDGLEETGKKSGDVDKTSKSFLEMATIVAGVATAVKAVVKGISAVVSAYGEYEQLQGGVETIFGEEASAQVVENANKAFQTAGLSASQYLETVTSFSASLIQSLEGDTTKAVEVADRAIVDMSDNANKMGTDISSIQNAYQGFAKQNYTMLDNLKLGYGGTKSEMERLLADANEYNRQQGIFTNYQIENYADIVNAIHDVQVQMGVAGATQLEASTTIEGSINALKSAFANLVVGLSGNTEDIDQLMQTVMDSFMTVVDNIRPVVENILNSFPDVLSSLIDMVIAYLPDMLASATDLFLQIVIGLAQALPDILKAIPQVISAIWDTIKEVDWIQLGKDIMQGIIDGIVSMVKSLFNVLGEILTDVSEFLGFGNEAFNNVVIDPMSGALVGTTTPTTAQQQSISTNTNVQIEFTGDLAQLGKTLQPVISYETKRLGGSLTK